MARPRIELTQREIRQIEALAALGFTEAEIAEALGISERTFRNKKANEDAIHAAWKRGKAKAKAVVAAVAFRNATDGDQRAVEFYLATFHGLSPKHADTLADGKEDPDAIAELGDPHEELLRRYDEIAKRQEAAETAQAEREAETIEREERHGDDQPKQTGASGNPAGDHSGSKEADDRSAA